MVVQGKFSAQIVYADTMIPFKEHPAPANNNNDGTSTNIPTYVEVEPDAEYFVSISTKSEDPIVAEVNIDGKNLGYNVSPLMKSTTPEPYLCGIVSRDEEGGTRKQALRFVKTPVVQKTEENKGIPPLYWTGTVEVSFYEGIASQSTSPRRVAFGSSWAGNTGDVGFMIGKSNPDKKKGVMSAAGETVQYIPPSSSDKNKRGCHTTYTKGGLLKTVHLKYCSTLGLIYAGILSKPPCWEFHRMTNGSHQDDHADKIDGDGAIDLS